ncbi:MAG: N-acetylmuramoyl-L-alanine amidase [Armatimonadetes bacterium]|nr:N-acetylmuramoyl-L-alanine amidase [Armatimonadota bacterium]MDE2207065.1 N-acetylmuramoyl-L-alanine amidase [Armatimonadota bacterium]
MPVVPAEAHERRKRWVLARAAVFGASVLAAAFLSVASLPAAGLANLHPVRLRILGSDFVSSVAPLSDGTDIWVPLKVFPELGMQAVVAPAGDVVSVVRTSTGQHADIALTAIDGRKMVALGDVARAFSAVVINGDDPPKGVSGAQRGVVYFLARVTGVQYKPTGVTVTTSLPTPYRTRFLAGRQPRAYIDVMGAWANEEGARSVEPGVSIHTGQFEVETARVVLDVRPGMSITDSDNARNSSNTVGVAIETAANSPQVAVGQKQPSVQVRTPIAAARADSTSASAGGVGLNVFGDDLNHTTGTAGPRARAVAHTAPAHWSPIAAAPIRHSTQLAYRGGKVVRGGFPVSITGIGVDDVAGATRLVIRTSGKVRPTVQYQPDGSGLAIHIPNAVAATSISPGSPSGIISALRVVPDGDPATGTRIDVTTTRVAGFTVDESRGAIVLNLRTPRHSGGTLQGKLIVVDPGHGGTSTGATGHDGRGVVYEKNIALAIALRLRDALEAQGANVLMTRDADVNVDLYERPRMADAAHADFFVSIHNDSNGTPNSASGTSTYYHLSDPSSHALAECVQRDVSAVTGLPSRGALSDGIMYAHGFAVLRMSTMPAILVEVAYINNQRDLAHLENSDFQENVAQAICQGLSDYVAGVGGRTANPQDQQTIQPTDTPPPLPGDGGSQDGH